MARHLRRLTLWFAAVLATLVLLAACAFAVLWWVIDPDDYRSQIQARASQTLGRQVRLTGKLRWQPGLQISMASDGGELANAPGFDSAPLLRWSRLRLGVALWPLLHRRVRIDRIDLDGAQVNLERNAQGAGNWQLQLPEGSGDPESAVTLRIGAVNVSNAVVRYRDAMSGADWRVSELAFAAQLPEDLAAAEREFTDVVVRGKVAGGPLPAGVPFSLRADLLDVSAAQVSVPAFEIHWADARLSGGAKALLGETSDVSATLALQAPSLRAVLGTAGVTPPPMNDSTTLGRLQFGVALHYLDGAITLDKLDVTLDDTRLTGTASLPRLQPLALRFDLVADRIDMDRYMKPDDPEAEPFELPLEMLKDLDAKGVLRIQQATVAGAVAKDVRIDVE